VAAIVVLPEPPLPATAIFNGSPLRSAYTRPQCFGGGVRGVVHVELRKKAASPSRSISSRDT
jgi:hypothetical protein